MAEWLEILLGSVVFGTIVTAIIQAIANRKKVKAEAEQIEDVSHAGLIDSLARTAKIQQETAASQLAEYSKRILQQDEKILALEGKLDRSMDQRMELQKEMADLVLENAQLKAELTGVKKELESRDRELERLRKRVSDFEARLTQQERKT